MFDGVGRRRDQKEGQLVQITTQSLNGYERNCLFRNNGNGTFTDVGYVNGADRIEDGRSLSLLDYDGDGQLDMFLRNYRQPAQLLRNTGGSHHWLALKLVGVHSNRDAIGARVTVTARPLHQIREVQAGAGFLSGSTLVQHFGLGPHARIDRLDVAWPSGTHTTVTDIAADQKLMLSEDSAAPVAVQRWQLPPQPADARRATSRTVLPRE
jgi:hypothetical protein